eukprot:scaffold426583_cov17-Prasinocladus_malaysianus.AAC.1
MDTILCHQLSRPSCLGISSIRKVASPGPPLLYLARAGCRPSHHFIGVHHNKSTEYIKQIRRRDSANYERHEEPTQAQQ